MSIRDNFIWIACAQAVRVGLQLLSLSVLARLLAPADFGLLAIASMISTFASLFRDLGSSAAIVRGPSIDVRALSGVFWGNLVVGAVLGLCIAASAPFAEAMLGVGGLSAVLVGISLTFPISALGATHAAMLEREQRFRALFLAELLAGVIGLAVAVVAALRGQGVGSLVDQALAYTAVSTAVSWLSYRWIPARAFTTRAPGQLLLMGSRFMSASVMSFVARNADNAIVGRSFGASALGSYSLGYRLMMFPVQNIAAMVSRAMLRPLSDSATHEAAAKLYLRGVRLTALLAGPWCSLLFVLRGPLVRLLFGEQWVATSELLVWFAPTGFLQAIYSSSAGLIATRGDTRTVVKLAALGMVLCLLAFVLGAQTSVTRLAMYYAGASVVHAAFCLYFAMRVVEQRMFVLFAQLLRPVALGIAPGMAAYILSAVLDLDASPWPSSLLVTLSASVTIWLGLLTLTPSRERRLLLEFLFSSQRARALWPSARGE